MEASPQSPVEAPTIAFHHRVIAASVLAGLAIIGFFGNTLVIFSVITTKKLRTVTNILVVNLAIADILTCSSLPFQIAGLLSQTGSYPIPEIICAIVAGVGTTSICCSVSTLVAIGFVRWYVITRSIRGHQGLNTPKNIAKVVLFIWMESIALMIIPPVLGLGTLGYYRYYGLCTLTDTNPLASVFVIFQGSVIITALALTLTFYGLILRHVLQHNKQFRDKFADDKATGSSSAETQNNKASSSSSQDSRPPMIKAINQKEIEITKNVFTVVCLFMICFLAQSVNFLIPGISLFTLYGYMILMANSVVNPIIYGLKHPNFQEAFKRILCRRRRPLEHVSN
ncbi:probable G-protein coupled receptor No9 [Strongylocentrotus purpuratus]|uniref:G-protein coupled receptors family 1 profile domain-containing protein n=1 Tax=Strongylocentrotus purpuratus TaxID=7668 RepID=A0A7M7RG49_STRPU|nr:probable G-protein coupled receptor No9 [Strongylocentrotus purpuratus]|eukprot:XP_789680.2 PREDICTED: probable G-protein coupled receptor No9 [Strongylocentrotus purpuratus]